MPRAWFTDVTAASGISALRFGEGANFDDLDGDGLPELFLPVVKGRNRLYQNLGGLRFRDVSQERGLSESGGIGAVFADLDADGRSDLYVVRGAYPYGRNLLYRREERGTFRDASAGAGASEPRNGISATAADFDGDGATDLFVCNWGRNSLFRNARKAGTLAFEDVTVRAGLAEEGRSWAALAADFSGDGRPDLFVARGGAGRSEGCRYYRNRGDGTFEDRTVSSGLRDVGWSLGAAGADFDADGDLDLFVTGYDGPDRLFLNDGSGAFVDATAGSGISSGRSVGVGAGLVDGDGLADLVVGGFAGPVRLFQNLGRGRFAEVGGASGLGSAKRNEGVALADADGDGDLDLYVTNYDGENRLYRNNLDDPRFLKVRPLPGRSAVPGAVARLRRSDGAMEPVGREGVQTVYGYCSQGPGEIVFRVPDGGPFDLVVESSAGTGGKTRIGPGVYAVEGMGR